MTGPILCLDSGTTSVKAAAFTAGGRLMAIEEVPNGALRRTGDRVEQDMAATWSDAVTVLRRVVATLDRPAAGLIVTAQGDGLWPLDADGQPCGHAITWLDGRSRGLLAEHAASGALDRIAAVLRTRPTTASQSLHLAWLARHEPGRLARIHHALRCKEWLFHCLTGELLGEPTSIVATWGDPATLRLLPDVEQALGLARGIALLPEMQPIPQTARPLAAAAAAATGFPAGLPVMLGPGDVQATAIGVGVGMRDGIRRASVFGTSAIHAHLLDKIGDLRPDPPGAMLIPFVEAGRTLYLQSGFNGTTAFSHAERLLGVDRRVTPHYSGLVLHPFLESGGERAPVTDADARACLFGLTASSTPAEIAWAAREALAFLARMGHETMDAAAGQAGGTVALGGGLAADVGFAQFMATALGRPVLRCASAHAGLAGLGLVAAAALDGVPPSRRAETWAPEPAETVLPDPHVSHYAERKYALFRNLLTAVSPLWAETAALNTEAPRPA